jgi:pheromone shutdown-related protein TraB
MIILIGTGHVFNLSQQLLDIFDQKQPDVICVELDKQRYNALLAKKADPEAYKQYDRRVPFIYKLLSKFQDGMASEYGVVAGQEMLTAIGFAKNRQLPVAFIDMNAQKLFKKMLKKMSFTEKLKLILSGLGGFFVSKKRVETELKKIEKNFDSYIERIGERFPTIKEVLVDERNDFMANQLTQANEQYSNIVAIVGDGHIPGLSRILEKKEIDFETIRLSELRNKEPTETDSSSASFSMEYREPQ